MALSTGTLIWGADHREDDRRAAWRVIEDRKLGDRAWRREVIALAQEHGWKLIYDRPKHTDPEPLPDIILINQEYVLAMVLKRDAAPAKEFHIGWLECWAQVAGAIAVYARPRDRVLVLGVLTHPWTYGTGGS